VAHYERQSPGGQGILGIVGRLVQSPRLDQSVFSRGRAVQVRGTFASATHLLSLPDLDLLLRQQGVPRQA